MEGLLPLIIIFVITSVVSSLKQNQKNKAAEEKRWHTTSAQVKMAQARAKTIAKAAPAKPMTPPAKVMQPTVHTHLEPNCDTHDAPGSLGVVSSEGKDPCHEPQLTHARSIEAEVPQEGGLTFDWSGDSMVKAIVMQEVLTRPAQRRAR